MVRSESTSHFSLVGGAILGCSGVHVAQNFVASLVSYVAVSELLHQLNRTNFSAAFLSNYVNFTVKHDEKTPWFNVALIDYVFLNF